MTRQLEFSVCEDCGRTYQMVEGADGWITTSHCPECWDEIEAMAEMFCPSEYDDVS